MLNTKKLLYVLPDLAYLAELLPGKKPNSFSIQSFKQINGDLVDGNKLLTDSLTKLGGKLDKDNYLVVLPDQIFTNTIVNIEADSESEVKEQIQEEVLADLNINSESHLIETFVLTEFKGTYKVQLSAVQKSMLAPLKAAMAKSKAKIKKIFPLSWTVKSLISLEPSISVLQLGSNLFLAKHYIGVDQPVIAGLDQTDKIVETVKTLKGSEPSIQTLYLLSNDLVEEELKENLSEVLPIQQLADTKDDESKIPPYVQKAITAGIKTISIEDFDIPQFDLSLVDASEIDVKSAKSQTKKKEQKKEEDEDEDLPKPSTKPTSEKTKKKKTKEKSEELEKEEVELVEEEETVSMETTAQTKPKEPETTDEDGAGDEEVDLQQFAQPKTAVPEEDKEKEKEQKKEEEPEKQKPKKKQKNKIIKNNDGLGNFLKMFFVGLASFAVTVAIGVGIGFGVLKLSNQGPDPVEGPVEEPTVVVSSTPAASPSPTPEPELDKEELSIKVVNATTQPGYAGQVSQDLEDAGYGEVVASNARGEYEEEFFALMEEENTTLINALSEDAGFDLIYSEEVEVEDPKQEYDAVIVLGQ